MKTITPEIERLLFALEAAPPFVKSAVGDKPCSSSGGPVAIQAILDDYNWDTERWEIRRAPPVDET